VAVVVVGLCSTCPLDGWRLEGEGHDRHDLALPGQQEALVRAVAATGTPVALVERDAARPLGITTTAAHLIGHTPDGRVWLQQRAADKATDPNRWDTLVGGLVSAGEPLATSLARETWEEAGLSLNALPGLRHLGRVSLHRPVPEGFQVQHIEVFDAVLGDAQAPENRDGEVQAFACVTREALVARLLAGDFTLEAALAFDRWLHAPPPAGSTGTGGDDVGGAPARGG
jgi:8-oxo-dGTP pyrophosphatase MutT (NUDIX family)